MTLTFAIDGLRLLNRGHIVHDVIVHDGGGGNNYSGNGINLKGKPSNPNDDVEVFQCQVYNVFQCGIGIDVCTGDNIFVHDNKNVEYCGQYGIGGRLVRGFGLEITANTVIGTGTGWSGTFGGSGIELNDDLGGPSDPVAIQGVVTGNTLTGNLSVGIRCYGRSDLQITNNTITGLVPNAGVGDTI